MNSLKEKVVIITGANAGVGEETARLFGEAGAKLVICARRVEKLEAVTKELTEKGVEVLAIPTDISKIEDVKNLIKQTIEKFGKLDVLVNNAGVLDKDLNAINRVDYDDLSHVIDINEKGTIYCMSEALKVMKSGASIVNIASVAGVYGCGGAAYVATKAAIIGVTKHTAYRFAKEQIRCNAICPGNITTTMSASLNPQTLDVQMFTSMQKHSDLTVSSCSPLDVAKVALFLASDDSAPITGQAIVTDYGADL